MARLLRVGLVQTALREASDLSHDDAAGVKGRCVDGFGALVERAAGEGARVVCMPALAPGPYFCVEQDPTWHGLAERIPDGPLTVAMEELAARVGAGLIVPMLERSMAGVFYHSAVVIDEHGNFLGVYRQTHIAHAPGAFEKFYFTPGDLGYPVFEVGGARVGVILGHDRHFPEAARELALDGAEVVLAPCAVAGGDDERRWHLQMAAHAMANQLFVGAVNRVGRERPLNDEPYRGGSALFDPSGRLVERAPRDESAALVVEIDLERIEAVRTAEPLFRDRRPETYDHIASF